MSESGAPETASSAAPAGQPEERRGQADPLEKQRPHNLILSRLPEEQFRSLTRLLVPVDMPQGMTLSLPHEAVEYIYLPVSGLISVAALTNAGEQVEVSLIGREGLAGVCALLGHVQLGHSVVVQGSGSALRIRTSALQEEFRNGGALTQVVHDFIYLQMAQMTQSVLCNRLHTLEARMSRRLLKACDLLGTNSLQVTQEFLAQALGARRSTVTETAGQLQREGLIDYTRGRVRIVHRPGLEARACDCYRIVRDLYRRVLGPEF